MQNRQKKWSAKWTLTNILEWQDAGRPVPPPQTVKVAMLGNGLKSSGYDVFIETGTLKGLTSGLMAWCEGVQVHTIEISEKYFALSAEKLADFKNVTRHLGDSGEVLPKLLSELDRSAVFWLDAHHSGGDTGMGDLMAPIKKELSGLFNHPVKNHMIFIDDMKDFKGHSGYLQEGEVVDWIAEQRPEYKVGIYHNILVCGPSEVFDIWESQYLNIEGLDCIEGKS